MEYFSKTASSECVGEVAYSAALGGIPKPCLDSVQKNAPINQSYLLRLRDRRLAGLGGACL